MNLLSPHPVKVNDNTRSIASILDSCLYLQDSQKPMVSPKPKGYKPPVSPKPKMKR